MGLLGGVFGRGFEALLREAYSDLLRSIGVEEYEVQHFKYIDIDGKCLAPGTVIEIDIVVRDKQLWLLELKSNVEEKDVAWFHVVSQAAEKILGRRADRRIILGVVVDKEAYEYAKKLGLEIVYVNLVGD